MLLKLPGLSCTLLKHISHHFASVNTLVPMLRATLNEAGCNFVKPLQRFFQRRASMAVKYIGPLIVNRCAPLTRSTLFNNRVEHSILFLLAIPRNITQNRLISYPWNKIDKPTTIQYKIPLHYQSLYFQFSISQPRFTAWIRRVLNFINFQFIL